MSIRINLTPPINPERISRIKIYRSLFADGGFSIIANLLAHDNGEFISTFEDPCGRLDHWYKVAYLEDGHRDISSFVLYKDSSAGRQSFTFPDGATISTEYNIVIGFESTRAEFEAAHGALDPKVDYYGSARLMTRTAQSYDFDLYDASASKVDDIHFAYDDESRSLSLSWTPRETETDPTRACSPTPVKIFYSVPELPNDWQVDTIYVTRSDELNGEYDVIAKLDSKSRFGDWKTSFVDFGGSEQFFYKVTFVYSRWNDSECKSEFYTSPASDSVSPIEVDGNVVAKITTSHLSINDMRTTESIEFRKYPYCGYHRFSPFNVFRGENASAYSRPNDMVLGGDCGGNNQFGGPLNIYERNLQRQQELLETTGEPVILLRRKWKGKQCPCMSKTEEHPINKCPNCFGTGFVGGFDRVYFNVVDREDGMILVRFYPAVDDLALLKMAGLDVVNQPSAWTLAQPIVRDRDILVQFDPIDRDREIWRYEVLDVTRNSFMGGITGAQQMRLQRLNRLNDIAYSIPLEGSFETELWDMKSNIHNSYGHRTGERSGHKISVDDEACVDLPTSVQAEDIFKAYSRKLWPFIKTNSVPSPSMVLDFSGPLYPLVFISFANSDKFVQVNSADTTINNSSILRYAHVELNEYLLKDYRIDIKSLNSGKLIKTITLPPKRVELSSSENLVFQDSVKLVLEKDIKAQSLVIFLIERV